MKLKFLLMPINCLNLLKIENNVLKWVNSGNRSQWKDRSFVLSPGCQFPFLDNLCLQYILFSTTSRKSYLVNAKLSRKISFNLDEKWFQIDLKLRTFCGFIVRIKPIRFDLKRKERGNMKKRSICEQISVLSDNLSAKI